jgi:hypothetical protein
MATTKKMKIEGKPVRPYNLYRIGLNDEIIELVVRADTLEELKAHCGPIGIMRSIKIARG